ncbi:MAG TPA: META domain-containing protein [Methanocorpusculum sp.]|nr:META domain-containing protein [Methanocorpusculum sp.]
MKYLKLMLWAVLVVSVLFCAGCVTTATTQTPSVFGTWHLTNDNAVTLILDENGNAGGQAQLNTYSGTYTIKEENKLQFSDFIRTLLAGDPETMQAEDIYFTKLHDTASFILKNGQLKFYDTKGNQLLCFEKQIRKALNGSVISAVPAGEDKVEVTVSVTNSGMETAKNVYANVSLLGKKVKSYLGTYSISMGDIGPGQTVSKTRILTLTEKEDDDSFDSACIIAVFMGI